MGTAAGTRVYVQHGWRATAVLSMAWMAMQFGVLLARGPHAPRKTWIGWRGGWSLRERPEVGEEAERTRARGGAEEEKAVRGEKTVPGQGPEAK
jgi:hypothetical protein